MAKNTMNKKEARLHNEMFMYGEVIAWHVHMVSHNRYVDREGKRLTLDQVRAREDRATIRQVVDDHLSLDLDIQLRESIRDHSVITFHITEWDEGQFGGIAGELWYDKESGMRGNIHMSGSFPRDLFHMLLSGAKVAMGIQTRKGFRYRKADVVSVAFSDIEHPQWIDQESGLI